MIRTPFALLLLAACLAAGESPTNHQITVTVRPGSMGVQFSKEGLKHGDQVTVTLQPASPYRIRDSRVSDPMLLGWRKLGNHIFQLTVQNPPTDKDWQVANFNGVLVKDAAGGGYGGTPKEEEYPFDFDGRVKRIGGDEGVSSDYKRNPPGKLTSEIGNCPETPEGKARLEKTKTANSIGRKFIGSIAMHGDLFMGQYFGALGMAGDIAANPVFLGSETGPSPGGTGNTVTIAYHGARDGVGGQALNERIIYNTWDNNIAAAKAAADAAEARLEAAKKVLAAANDALAKGQAAAATAAKEAADAQAAVNALIDGLVKAVADQLAAARSTASAAQTAYDTAVAAEAKAKADLDEALRIYKRNSTQYRLALSIHQKAQAATQAALANRKAADANVAKLEAALDKAREKALKDKRVIAAQKLADDKAATARRLADAVGPLQQAVTDAEKARDDASREFDRLNDLYWEAVEDEKAYQQALASLLGHERRHRDILRDHVRELTELLAKLRSIGWSPDSARAVQLSRDYWPICVDRLEKSMRAKEAAAQEKFDGDTDHGRK